MPAIPPSILDCAIYLYPSVEHAERGDEVGGSGFLVILPVGADKENPTHGTLWAVSNRHVAKCGHPVVRLNNLDGAHETIQLRDSNWIHHAGGADVAVARIGLSMEHHRFRGISPGSFLRGIDDLGWFAVGSDALMVGRLIGKEGKQKNTPAVRFGNVSMLASLPGLPVDPIPTNSGLPDQNSFLVEMHSRSGFSGSPVFVTNTYPSEVTDEVREGKKPYFTNGKFHLLGVQWGYLPGEEARVETTTETLGVPQNSGLALVVPSWELASLFEQEEVMKIRKEDDERFEEEHPPRRTGVSTTKADEASQSRDAFYRDLDRAIEPDDKPSKEGS